MGRLGVAVGVAILVASGLAACQSKPADPDRIAIAAIPDAPADPAPGPAASTGSYTWSCGVNAEGHRNSANVVVAPGIIGTEHHTHDYVGNVSTNASSTNASLAAAGTTCANGDKSTYYWPVLRIPNGQEHGAIQVPTSVTLSYAGNPASPVVLMPRFLRLATGDARAVVAGPTFARPMWTCSGAPRRRTAKYPICPTGDEVLRVFDFPSCWDGRRLDSPNHRAHLIFPVATGDCPHGTFAVPRLRITVAYTLPTGVPYLIDSFPDQHNSPRTDHALAINLMPDPLMSQVVHCLNTTTPCQP
jgi:hypothetical protein